MTSYVADKYCEERSFIERARATYTLESQQDKVMRELAVRTFAPYVQPEWNCLHLGYSAGVDAGLLRVRVKSLDIVEGCAAFVAAGRAQGYENVAFHHCLFEEFATDKKYDAVFALYVLEHVFNVPELLLMIKSILEPQGLLFVVVPNARALSRQLALHMGILADLKALTKNDHSHGHRRVYDRALLSRDLTAAGFQIIAQGGLLLKLLADFQMNDLLQQGVLTSQHVDGLYKLGLEYPDLCGTLFSVCKPV